MAEMRGIRTDRNRRCYSEPARESVLAVTDLPELACVLLGPPVGADRSERWLSTVHGKSGETPQLSIVTANDGTQRWVCSASGVSGTAADLVMNVMNIGHGEALEWLAELARTAPGRVSRHRGAAAGRAVKNLRRSPRTPPGAVAALRLWTDECYALLGSAEASSALSWLLGRGLSESTVAAFGLGYDPGAEALPRAEGLPVASPAVVWPARDPAGRVVYAQSRRLSTGRPKYANPSSKDPSGFLLYQSRPVSWHRRPVPQRDVLMVVEGIPDAAAAWQAGYDTAAVLGAAQSARALPEIVRFAGSWRYRAVAVCFDDDTPGRKHGKRIARGLTTRGIRAVTVRPEKTDIGEWLQHSGAGSFAAGLRRKIRAALNVHVTVVRCSVSQGA